MLNECFNRHILLKGFLATTAVAALGGSFGATAEGGSTLTFAELDRVRDAADHWPEGYDRQVLLRWGDVSSDGTMVWMPLIAGEGPLTAEAGFANQADVVLNTRAAADLLGATPMDAPEGFIPHTGTGKLYVAMTENEDRLPAGEDEAESVNPANPRGPNPHGHLLELVPPGDPDAPDHAADIFTWDVFALCGDPSKAEDESLYHADTTANGWFTDPDNIGVDPAGRIWVTTDGPPPDGMADAVYAMDNEGPGRALPRLFYIPPTGPEACSPTFTPDGASLFMSVQHPGELRLDDMEDAETLEEAGTSWPDFADGMPARPSLVVLTKRDGGVVGS